jgi:hypothetical protein
MDCRDIVGKDVMMLNGHSSKAKEEGAVAMSKPGSIVGMS